MVRVTQRRSAAQALELPIERFRMQDDVNGRIRHVLLQAGDKQPVDFYRSLIGAMGDDVQFSIAYPDGRFEKVSPEAKEALTGLSEERLGRVNLYPLHTSPSRYAQDAFIALSSDAGPSLILGDDALVSDRQGIFFNRAGDAKVLEAVLGGRGFVRVSPEVEALGLSWFQGGDVVSDERSILLGPDMLNQNLYRSMVGHQRAMERVLGLGYWMSQRSKDDVKWLINVNMNESFEFDDVWTYTRRDLTKMKLDDQTFVEKYRRVLEDVSKPLPSYTSYSEGEQQEFIRHLKAFYDISMFLHMGAPSETVDAMLAEVSDKVGVVSGGRKVALLGGFDRRIHHIDTHVTPIGKRTVLVGDSRRGLELLSSEERKRFEEWTLGFNEEAAGELDSKADQMRGLGYAVDRIPVVAKHVSSRYGDSTSPFVSYNNVFLEVYPSGGRIARVVYLPEYGFPALDAEAAEVYRRNRFRVVPIHGLEDVIKTGSSERCNGKVLQRDPYTPRT